MASFLIQYNKKTDLCREVIEFPDGAEAPAEWNGAFYERLLGTDFQIRIIMASSFEGIANEHFFIMHDEPVPLRSANTEELAMDTLEKYRASEEARGLR